MKKSVQAIIICSHPGPDKSDLVKGLIRILGKRYTFISNKSVLKEGFYSPLSKREVLENFKTSLSSEGSQSKIHIYFMTMEEFAKAKTSICSEYNTVNVFVRYSGEDILKLAKERLYSDVKTSESLAMYNKLEAMFNHPSNFDKFDVIIDDVNSDESILKIGEAVQSKVYCKCVTF